jgi:hypothetical protein
MRPHKARKNRLAVWFFGVYAELVQHGNNATQNMQHPTNSSPHSLSLRAKESKHFVCGFGSSAIQKALPLVCLINSL